MPHVDFAVIGGGPAGASAARRLALGGADCLLFERQRMPRAKPCGGALSSHGLAALGFPLPGSLIDRPVHGMRVHIYAETVEARFPEPIAVLVTRAAFDHYLVEQARAAGAGVAWEAVRGLAVRPDGVGLTTAGGEWTARCAIICEGSCGRLSRAVRPPDTPRQRLFCLAADLPAAGGTRPASGAANPSGASGDDVIDIYHRPLDWGYGWVFRHGAYDSVGVGGLAAVMHRPREAFERFVAECGLAAAGAAVRGHFIPCGGIRRRMVADRVLLAGDAAGLADPFQGEGLAYAIRSGQLAADAALEAAARGDFSRRGLAGYETACRETFDREFARALALARMLRWCPSPVLQAVMSDPDVLRRFLDIPAGKASYRRFMRWFVPRLLGRWMRSGFPRLRRAS